VDYYEDALLLVNLEVTASDHRVGQGKNLNRSWLTGQNNARESQDEEVWQAVSAALNRCLPAEMPVVTKGKPTVADMQQRQPGMAAAKAALAASTEGGGGHVRPPRRRRHQGQALRATQCGASPAPRKQRPRRRVAPMG